jgi:hypothetical protein
MESNVIKLNQPKVNQCELESTTTKMDIGNVFAERKGYLNELALFIAHFNSIPNFISERYIDCRKAHKWFAVAYQHEIKDFYFDKRYFPKSKNSEFDDLFYFMFDDLLVDFDTQESTVRFLFRKTNISEVETVIEKIKKFKVKKAKRKPEISLLINNTNGIETKSMQILKPKLNIEDNYNDDFREIHQTIVRRLSKKYDKGLVLLHGRQGTGKTAYIRYLVSLLKKNVIFLPPNMAGAITNPNLISILIDNPNSIFVIEDAENILLDREKDGNSPVSALLNISDGLLSDCLNVQVICTFNTDISKIDSALLRKGRLIAKYEFKELEVKKAQMLSQKLGYTTEIKAPMTVSAIYNPQDIDFQKERIRAPIGFK